MPIQISRAANLNKITIALIMAVYCSGCLKVPTAQDKGISFSTQSIDWPIGQTCIKTPPQKKVKEIMIGKTLTVLVAAGDQIIPDDKWETFNPGFGNVKNQVRHVLFDRSCLMRSPDMPPDCKLKNCLSRMRLGGWTWARSAQVESVDCLPKSRYCSSSFVPPSHLAFIVIQKCHEMSFSGRTWVLSGPNGEQAIMHATADGKPKTDVALPDGWRIDAQDLMTPLTLKPAGEENDCYFTIVRDHAFQSYHMFNYVDRRWPPEQAVNR